MIKMQIGGNLIKYSSRKKRNGNNILLALQKMLKRLKENFNEDPNLETEHGIHLVNGDIEQIIGNQIKGAQIRAKLNWIKEGEKQNDNEKHIKRIITQEGNIIGIIIILQIIVQHQ